MPDASPDPEPISAGAVDARTKSIKWLLALIAALALAGALLGIWIGNQRAGNPDPANWFNVFYVLFALNEPTGLAVVIAFTLFTVLWILRGAPAFLQNVRFNPRLVVPLMALSVFVIAAAGTSLVFQQHALTADENMADFQARIFLSGKVRETVPEFWRPMIRLIIPTHATYHPETHTWMASYLPVYAAIRALFMSVGAQWLTNAALAVVSIFAIAGVARNLWPGDRWKPLLAAGLLGASPQFLLMAMTGYAMPAHLAFNLVWLWLYTDETKRRFWITPLVGVGALGLHQPFFHALFVTPFLVRLVLTRRWKASFWFAAVYLVGIACCFLWWKTYFTGFTGTGSAGTFGLYRITALIQAMYISLLIGWLAFPVPLLTLLGVARLKKEPPLLLYAGASCVLTFGFYVFVRLDQAHGWGDRYFHGTLGCLILLAVAGWDSLAAKIGPPGARTFATVGIAAALLIQLPLRSVQAEQFARPFVTAAADFRNSDADVVAFDPRMAWYSADLRRNDADMSNRPVILTFPTIQKEEAELLEKTFPRGRRISEEDLRKLGLDTKLDERFAPPR